MIYLKQSYNIHPATPATRDRLVAAVNEFVLPANERLEARLVGAWFAHEEWFSQIIHVTEFDDLAALGRYREAAENDGQASEGIAQLENLAPEQHVELVEPLGPIATTKLHEAIASSGKEPVGTYTFAILEVDSGKLDQFAELLGAAQDRLPIVACWRDVSGNPNRIIDLWKGDTGRGGYRPTDDGQNAFFEPLRQIAPTERMMRLHAMPYSPLQ
jgi:hypothetical protein